MRLLISGLLLFALVPALHAEDKLPFDAIQVADEFRNPWPADWEAAFRERAKHSLDVIGKQKPAGGTYGENEKNYYPRLMVHFLIGNRATALKGLQEQDYGPADDMKHTLGIDYYWCFTLKGQMRKYFLFGEYLDEDYRQRMFDGAKIWTEQDPTFRPHPVYGKGKGNPNGEDWSPSAKGSWVDIRGTDNLRVMRDTAIYLMAEETKNEATRSLYKKRLIADVRMLYFVGQSEWDSENYHSHALSPYHNLYDFAKDREVKQLAKAALDWLYTCAAVKYYRGGYGGPNCRDYGGGNVVFGANATHPLWLYFGESPQQNPTCDRDDVYHITSPYRPPAAVVALAKKQFERPVELFAAKAPYEFWEPGKYDQPRYYETDYFGKTYQLGSVVSAKPEATWNIAPLKMMVENSARGVDYFVVNTAPVGEHSRKNPGDQIAQYGNKLIWLRPSTGESTFYLQLPKTAKTHLEKDLWLIEFEKTWIAIWPLGLKQGEDRAWPEKSLAKYGNEQVLTLAPNAGKYCGFALEAGELGTYKDFSEFRKAIFDKAKVEQSGLERGEVVLSGSDGQQLAVAFNAENDLPNVKRDGAAVVWKDRPHLYRASGKSSPIEQDWLSGKLRVTAGGHEFRAEVDAAGKATFTNGQTK